VDRNPIAASSQFFPVEQIERHIRDFACEPYEVGELEYDRDLAEPLGFQVGSGDKALRLWTTLRDGKPPRDMHYVIGCDVSAGTGASNSVLSVVNAVTGEKVAEYVSPRIDPPGLAVYAAALGNWFEDRNGVPALVVAEAPGGHNRQFLRKLMELNYANLYYKQNTKSQFAEAPSDRPGWGSGREAKRELLGDYGAALVNGSFLNRSRESLAEMRQYVFLPDGGVDHVAAQQSRDPSGARDNHGDRVMADALAWLGMRDERPNKPKIKDAIPVGSMAWRFQQREARAMEMAYW